MTVTPSSVDFGSVGVAYADTPEVVTLSNNGVLPVTVSSIVVTGTDAADFSIGAESCTSGAVGAAGACTISTGFKPSALGKRTTTLTINGPDPVGTRTIALSGTGVQPPSGVGWGSTFKAGPAYTWITGNALARTVQSGAQRLHVAYATDRIGSAWAKDAGPYAGVYYVRSTTGSTWSTAKRLNSSTQHATRLGIAAAGSRVYAAWVTQTRIYKYSPTAPRVLYVRVNTNHGGSTYWKSPIRLTSSSGRVDYPSVGASGYDVYVAYTDSVTGAVRVATSHDRGATWKTMTVGSTTLSGASGKSGYPSIAVAGSTVAVAWLADGAGGIKARVSINRGSSWGTAASVASASNGGLNMAVRGTRVALAWTTDDEVVVRQGTASAWGDPVTVASLEPGGAAFPYSPVVALQDPGRVAVAWSETPDADTSWSSLRWIESADGGSTWFQPQTLSSTASSSHRANDGTSVQWPSAGTRYVVWNGWTYGASSYRLYLRAGTGSPVGPTSLAPAWTPPASPELLPVRLRSEGGERVAR